MSMNTPAFVDTQFVDENGMLTPVWKKIMQQLLEQLQINFSDEGLILPTQSAANLTILDNINSNNSLIIDSDNNLLKVNLDGTYKTVQTM